MEKSLSLSALNYSFSANDESKRIVQLEFEAKYYKEGNEELAEKFKSIAKQVE